jgi:hypothetical protein
MPLSRQNGLVTAVKEIMQGSATLFHLQHNIQVSCVASVQIPLWVGQTPTLVP